MMRVACLLPSVACAVMPVSGGSLSEQQLKQPPAVYNDEVGYIGVSLLQTRARLSPSAAEAAAADASADGTGELSLARFLRDAADNTPTEFLRSEVKARMASNGDVEYRIVHAADHDSDAALRAQLLESADAIDAQASSNMSTATGTKVKVSDRGGSAVEGNASAKSGEAVPGAVSVEHATQNSSIVLEAAIEALSNASAISGKAAVLESLAASGTTQNSSVLPSRGATNSSIPSTKDTVAPSNASAKRGEVVLDSIAARHATENITALHRFGAANSSVALKEGTAASINASAKSGEAVLENITALHRFGAANSSVASAEGNVPPSNASGKLGETLVDHHDVERETKQNSTSLPSRGASNSSKPTAPHSMTASNSSGTTALAKQNDTGVSVDGVVNSSSSATSHVSTAASDSASLISASAAVEDVLASNTGRKGLLGAKDLPDVAIAALVASLALTYDELLKSIPQSYD